MSTAGFSLSGKRVLIVGDSHSQVLGPLLAARLRSRGARVVDVVANPGWSTARYLSEGNVASKAARAGADVVIIELGGNDWPRSLEAYAGQLGELVRRVQRTGARVIWLGPATATKEPWKANHRKVASWQSSVLPQMGVEWIDSIRHTYGGHRADGVHFTRTGYAAWADGIIDELSGLYRPKTLVPIFIVGVIGLIFWATVRGPGRRTR